MVDLKQVTSAWLAPLLAAIVLLTFALAALAILVGPSP